MKIFLIFFVLVFAKASADNVLLSGNCLKAGQQLTSTSGCFAFIFQSDGNAVIYRLGANNSMTAIFSTQTYGTGADNICMQTDGNLVVYGGTRAYFSTGTSGTTGNRVIMQDDGNLVIYNSNSQVFWASNTAQTNVTCQASTTTTTVAPTTTTPATTTNSEFLNCDILKFLFDKNENFLKYACWIQDPNDQDCAVEVCKSIGMRLFVPSTTDDVTALAKATIEIFGTGGYTSIWISGNKMVNTPWRDSNSGGQDLFTNFSPNIVDYSPYSPGKCLSLSSFGVDGYQLVAYDCTKAQSFWCEF
ncbi:hypothetical protein PVAND_014783 [Polypedilum vanderplanki]|uniref:Bulb-type lectin domain-containing protein n=1 Tax=Polypedilum vanderplanki TaxID=319348 RepID=A0A9J6BAQ8_POLVA|nr:hypothetical protein PVAND_014783 [Polypedilum vanderplanki]